MPAYFTHDGKELLAASWSFEEWAIGSGSLRMIEEPSPGDKITIVKDSEPVFTGIVTRVRRIHEDAEYAVDLKDPVSALLHENVEYDGGTVSSVLAGIMAEANSSISGSSSIPLFGTHEDPALWVDLVRTISLATGKILRYLPDGTYELAEPGAGDLLDPFEALTGVDMERYANQVVLSVDADWTEDVDPSAPDTVVTESGYGIFRTITKRGEQLKKIVTDLGDDGEVTEQWTWDGSGNLTRYDKEEMSTLEEVESYATYTVGIDGKLTVYEESTVRRRDNPMASWYNYRRYEKTTETWLDDEAPIKIDEYVYWFFQEGTEWHNKEWVRRTSLPAMPGTVASSRNEYYQFSEADEAWHLQKTVNEGGLRKPEILKVLQVNKLGVHMTTTASDEGAITAVGLVEKELALVGLTRIDDLEAAAEAYGLYCSRCKIATLTVPVDTYLIGDTIEWDELYWTIDSVQYSLRSGEAIIYCSTYPLIEEIKAAVGVDNTDLGKAIVSLIERKGTRLNNITKAQIVGQIDFETYSVQLLGEPAGKTRTARVDYQQGVTFKPEQEVLLARATGKQTQWEIITRRRDEPTIITDVPFVMPLPSKPFIVKAFLGRTTYMPEDEMLLSVTNLDIAQEIEVDWGDEGKPVIRKYHKDDYYSPTIYWNRDDGNPWDDNFDDYLYNGHDSLYLRREILAPLPPDEHPVQNCTGKIRIKTDQGEWSNWASFSYKFKPNNIDHFEYTLGEEYQGSTEADAPSNPVRDCTFRALVDFSPLLAERWQICFGDIVEGSFVFQSWNTGPYFILYDKRNAHDGIPLKTTGKFVYRYSEDGAAWHSDPRPDDLFVQVGNGASWGNALEVQHSRSMFVGSFGVVHFEDGQGWSTVYDWFTLDDAGGGMREFGPITYRLGFYGTSKPAEDPVFGGKSAFGPAFPALTSECQPILRFYWSYDWRPRNDD